MGESRCPRTAGRKLCSRSSARGAGFWPECLFAHFCECWDAQGPSKRKHFHVGTPQISVPWFSLSAQRQAAGATFAKTHSITAARLGFMKTAPV